MSDPGPKRAPKVFEADDPAVIVEPARELDSTAALPEVAPAPAVAAAKSGGRINWLATMVAALMGLTGLAASLSFAHFVTVALARDDWIGLVGWGLLGIAALAGLVIALKELVGLMRLGRLAKLRKDAEKAKREGDLKAERVVVRRLRAAMTGRADVALSLKALKEHEGDVRDPGDLLALADREIVAPLDAAARRMILASAKRVTTVTALSPMALIAVGYVLVENLRLLRGLATLYGGRPGFLGGLRLARMVVVHLIATGGVALTDDMIGQFIGQDLARRLSRRLGEGLFNGALTARVGAAALEVCRPLPFIVAKPVRVRDIVAEIMRREKQATTGPQTSV